ncbi:DUF6801 domain-containing protein [Amycolatopsis jiangsuensis]|uniref:DUF6801 domain-containing protein n=1 Tax=Amycolatopsis jiangsuensis TaxID=1181879 RepID=A0A840J5N5_9PSEU|nr:DUF6801 domain-containing protein [Amycolatopsis jiangsuensis]MBB4688718.1 hypothetical protein [Amycolatopsis jiangsuensis]
MKHPRSKTAMAAAATGVLGLVAASLVAGAQTSFADPVSLSLNYHCTLPLVGSQPLKVVINTDLPASVPTGEPTGAFDIQAVATINADTVAGLSLIGATTIEGQAIAQAAVAAPGIDLPVSVPTDVPKTDIPASGELDVNATGSTPSLTFDTAGQAQITVGDLELVVTPRKADGSVTGITPDGTIDAPCTQDEGQDNTLATFDITDGSAAPQAVSEEAAVSDKAVSDRAVADKAVVDKAVTDKTVADERSVSPKDTIKYSFAIDGSTTLKALGSTAPIKGSFDADVDLAGKKFTGDLKVDPTHTDFKLMGFLEGSADVQVTENGQQSGTLEGTGFTTDISFSTFLTTVNLYGIPVSTDPKCGTTETSTASMVTGPDFDLLTGGQLTGSYALSDFANCGAFNDIISGFAKSDGNTMDLNLTKQ